MFLFDFFKPQEADMAMGSITQTAVRETAVDFSYPYFYNRMGFMTKKPSLLPKIGAILWPYDNNVWIPLILTIPLFSLLYWIFSKIDKLAFGSSYNLGEAVFQVSQILLMKGK